MKKVFSIFILAFVILSCSKDSTSNNNPYLPTYRFNSSIINLSLPSYSALQFPGNVVVYNEIGVGVLNRIFILNTGSGFLAWDAACPNQEISGCSTMTLIGIKAVCPCDEVEYSLYSGQAEGMQYPMLQYRVEDLGNNTIRVYN